MENDLDGYYGSRGVGIGYPPRNIQEQVDAIMLRLAGEPEPESAPDDGMSHGYAPPPPPRNWRDTADSIVAQLEREQAERADTGDGAGDGGWPMTGYAESTQAEPPPASPSYGSAAYDWLKREAYLQADKIGDDLGRYYRDVTTDPLGAIYAAAPSFGPFGAEAGQLLGAAGRALNAFGSFLGRNKPYPLARAMGPAELAEIEATGGVFRNPLGIERKYFAETPEGAASYARQAYEGDLYQGPYTIVNSSIPRRHITSEMRTTVDRGGIPTIVVHSNDLPLLRPGMPLPYSPMPKNRK